MFNNDLEVTTIDNTKNKNHTEYSSNKDASNRVSCPVCWEEVPQDNTTTDWVCLPCDHRICRSCILRIIENKDIDDVLSCPLCRRTVLYSQINSAVKPRLSLKDYPVDASFDFVDPDLARLLVPAYQVVQENNAWETLLYYTKLRDEGYQFPSSNSEVMALLGLIFDQNPLHSGWSLGYTLKHLHAVAQYGYAEYKQQYMASNA